MPLHSGQVRYLRHIQTELTKPAYERDRIYILVPSNRWGKSSLVACLQIWYLFYKIGVRSGNQDAWYKSEYRTANIAPAYALTEPVFKYITQILTSRFPINLPDGRTVPNECQIEWFYEEHRTQNTPPRAQYFANNSYIEHRTLGSDKGDSLQGKPYGLITYDEGGRSSHLREETSSNILPRLFDLSGDLHIPSTPDQESHSILDHYEMYQDGLHGRNQTYTMKGSIYDNTFFTEEQIKAQVKLFEKDPMRDQILEGKFLLGGDNIYSPNDIMDAETELLNDGIRYEEGHNYVVGIDTAISSDEMVYTVLREPCGKDHDEMCRDNKLAMVRMVACKGNAKSPQMHMNDLVDLCNNYKNGDNLAIMLETWNGESARYYIDMPYELQAITTCYGSWQPTRPVIPGNDNKPVKQTQNIKKADIIIVLQKYLSAKELAIPKSNQKLSHQLSIYREDDVKISTDRVISLALATWLANDRKVKTAKLEWVTIEW